MCSMHFYHFLKISSGAAPAKDQTRLRIEQMEAEREERRRLMLEVRLLKF